MCGWRWGWRVSVNWQDDPGTHPEDPAASRGQYSDRSERRMVQLSEERREVKSSLRMVAYVLIGEMIMLFSCALCGAWMWLRP